MCFCAVPQPECTYGTRVIMAAQQGKPLYFAAVVTSFFFFFSSPILRGRRLDIPYFHSPHIIWRWRRGVVVSVVRRMNEVTISGPVSTGMGDRLWAGIPSRYVTSQLGQLSLAFLQGR